MSSFGLNRFAQAFAVAVNDAGDRIADKPTTCVDRLAYQLFEWGGAKDLDVSFRFVYPFVGGTAVSHSFNLVDPTIGRIEWQDTITHTSSGITGDGVSGYGGTGVTLAGPLQSDAFVSCGIYSRTANAGPYCEIGNYVTPGIFIYCRAADALPKFYNGATPLQPAGLPNSQGVFSSLRTSAAAFFCYRNGVLLASNTSANVAADPPSPFLILARPNPPTGAVDSFSNRNLAFAFLSNAASTPGIGPIFTSIKQEELYNYIQSFQTKLGRQV